LRAAAKSRAVLLTARSTIGRPPSGKRLSVKPFWKSTTTTPARLPKPMRLASKPMSL